MFSHVNMLCTLHQKRTKYYIYYLSYETMIKNVETCHPYRDDATL